MLHKEFKVILVDDSYTQRETIKAEIKKVFKNVTFKEFVDGKPVIKYLKEHIENDIGLIISDIHMPECSGFEILGFCKENNLLEETEMILISGAQDNSDEEKAIEAEIIFMKKPINKFQLERIMKKMIVRVIRKNRTALRS